MKAVVRLWQNELQVPPSVFASFPSNIVYRTFLAVGGSGLPEFGYQKPKLIPAMRFSHSAVLGDFKLQSPTSHKGH